MQDQDLEHLKGSDQFTVEQVSYRLVKSYRLRVCGGATVIGVTTEMKDLRDTGFTEVQLGMDDTGAAILALKQIDLTDLSQLEKEIGDEQK